MATRAIDQDADRNPDPITDAPGAHPVGVGMGAATGGAVAGAAAGAVGGPIGAAVGAVVGGVVGGYAGKAIAEAIDPTVEEAYWRENYPTREYYDPEFDYEEYAPAYRYGWESRARFADRQFEDVESDLEQDWQAARGTSRLDWQRARFASRDAWERVGQQFASGITDVSRKPR